MKIQKTNSQNLPEKLRCRFSGDAHFRNHRQLLTATPSLDLFFSFPGGFGIPAALTPNKLNGPSLCRIRWADSPVVSFLLSRPRQLRCRHRVNCLCIARCNKTSQPYFTLLPTAREYLLHFFVRRVLAARFAKLTRLEPVSMFLPVLRSRVISVLTFVALQRNNFTHSYRSLS